MFLRQFITKLRGAILALKISRSKEYMCLSRVSTSPEIKRSRDTLFILLQLVTSSRAHLYERESEIFEGTIYDFPSSVFFQATHQFY